jgi:hypothetical protein
MMPLSQYEKPCFALISNPWVRIEGVRSCTANRIQVWIRAAAIGCGIGSGREARVAGM